MTPKEKASYLFQKYLPYTDGKNIERIRYNTLVCSLIVVDEILEELEPLLDADERANAATFYSWEFWKEVKQELHKI